MMLIVLNLLKDFDYHINEDNRKDFIIALLDEIDKEQQIYIEYIRALFEEFDEHNLDR